MKSFICLFLLLPAFALAQFSGRVVFENNQGVPYASVLIKNTNTGTTADSLGYFTIPNIPKHPFTLVISYAGYETHQRVIRNDNVNNIVVQLQSLYTRDTVIVTSRRRRELLQDVPIPISVITGSTVEDAGAFNVNRVKEFVPSVQLYSSKPRNTSMRSISMKSRVAAAGRA